MHFTEQTLLDLALGVLDEASTVEAERHLGGCAECRAALGPLRRASSALGAAGPAVTPRARVASELFDRFEGAGRFEDLLPQLRALFDLDEDAARALLSDVDRPEKWEDGPSPGIRLLPVAAGPKRSSALAAIAKLPEGVPFPSHEHAGRETMFVLQGGFREETGREIWRGEELVMEVGSSHEIVGLAGPVCIAATLLEL